MQQQGLFYEDAFDALKKSISAAGKTSKEVAMVVYPGRQIETAKSLLSRAMSPENTDVHLNVESLLTVMRETRPDDFIYYLCDEFGFERPERRNKEDFKKEIKGQLKSAIDLIKNLQHQLDKLEV